jgi:ketosteroid isomerase-like protein
MKGRNRAVLIVVVVALLLASPGAVQAGQAKAQDEAAITKVLHDSFGWAETKDRALFESTFARDQGFFTFYPDSKSTVVGWSQLEKLLAQWMDPRNKALGFDIRDLRITISQAGDAAWFSAIVDDEGEWDGKPWSAKGIRWTGVLEERQGTWVIVQQHMSRATDDAEAELQTSGADARRAALDYIEGWFEGDASRVEKVLHPGFVRRIAAVTVAGDDFFWPQDRAQFLEAARRGGDVATPADKRQIAVRVCDLARTTATVRVDSAYYVEYLGMVRLRDRWQIVNVLWENVPNDKKEAVIDYRVLADYVGTYRHARGAEFKVIVDGRRIFLQQGDDPKIEFFPESETDFFTKGYKSAVTFVRDPAGKVTHFVKHLNYRDFTFVKVE